jgi:uncharacterized membrane protein
VVEHGLLRAAGFFGCAKSLASHDSSLAEFSAFNKPENEKITAIQLPEFILVSGIRRRTLEDEGRATIVIEYLLHSPAAFLTLSALALWGLATWEMVGKAKETETIHKFCNLWWLIGFVWLFVTILFLWVIGEILASWLSLRA